MPLSIASTDEFGPCMFFALSITESDGKKMSLVIPRSSIGKLIKINSARPSNRKRFTTSADTKCKLSTRTVHAITSANVPSLQNEVSQPSNIMLNERYLKFPFVRTARAVIKTIIGRMALAEIIK